MLCLTKGLASEAGLFSFVDSVVLYLDSKKINLQNLKKYRPFYVVVAIAAGMFFFNGCHRNTKPNTVAEVDDTQPAFKYFAGSASCATCHASIYKTHLATAHQNTSMPATEENILGSFAVNNQFVFDAANKVQMEKREGKFYQTHYYNSHPRNTATFDVITGSGRKGQSYLTWQGDRLFQLPITFFSATSQWCNSPGYPPHTVAFNRPITTRCLECHTTFVGVQQREKNNPEKLIKDQIIYGVSCEKCHGPGAKHVAYQQQNPQDKEPHFIVNPSRLSRQQVLDLCGLCHSGALTKTKPSFSFTAGDTLTKYFSTTTAMMNAANIDVHGNQLGLLSLSRCFIGTNMTCGNCHSAHTKEGQNLALYSSRCQICHNNQPVKTCALADSIGPAISKNCIDCHMPKQASHAVAVFLPQSTSPTPAMQRTHYIKIYPDATKKWKPISTAQRDNGRAFKKLAL